MRAARVLVAVCIRRHCKILRRSQGKDRQPVGRILTQAGPRCTRKLIPGALVPHPRPWHLRSGPVRGRSVLDVGADPVDGSHCAEGRNHGPEPDRCFRSHAGRLGSGDQWRNGRCASVSSLSPACRCETIEARPRHQRRRTSGESCAIPWQRSHRCRRPPRDPARPQTGIDRDFDVQASSRRSWTSRW